MKKLYVVITFTGTFLSRMIKIYSNNNYTHVSLSLDKDLKEMYSFGRLNPYNPFIGGFVHEGTNIGTFKRFKHTTCEIYEIEVRDSEYKIIKKLINEMKKNKDKYSFNITGMFATVINLRLRKKYGFYCAEFCKYLLDNAHVKNNLPDAVKPSDFAYLDNSELVYKGILRKYVGD